MSVSRPRLASRAGPTASSSAMSGSVLDSMAAVYLVHMSSNVYVWMASSTLAFFGHSWALAARILSAGGMYVLSRHRLSLLAAEAGTKAEATASSTATKASLFTNVVMGSSSSSLRLGRILRR